MLLSQSMTIQDHGGFTLIELMVAVAILAVISAIAVPLYDAQSRKGKRPDGMALLEEVAQVEQRYFSDYGTFTTTITALPGIKSATSPGGYYNISVAPGETGNIASSFVATATPLTAAQKNDACEFFTISNLGVRGASAKDANGVSISDAATRVMCWGK
jgi:type IV pilus assembly protein PilE